MGDGKLRTLRVGPNKDQIRQRKLNKKAELERQIAGETDKVQLAYLRQDLARVKEELG